METLKQSVFIIIFFYFYHSLKAKKAVEEH